MSHEAPLRADYERENACISSPESLLSVESQSGNGAFCRECQDCKVGTSRARLTARFQRNCSSSLFRRRRVMCHEKFNLMIFSSRLPHGSLLENIIRLNFYSVVRQK
jgi:hypothetical protein